VHPESEPPNAQLIPERALTCQQTLHRANDIAQWSGIRRSALVSAANALRQLAAAARFTCQPKPPVCPMLVLSSNGDDLVNPVCETLLASRWQLAHDQHPWAGRDLPHDDGAWGCERLVAWPASK
jgi:hypothetical protein